MTYNQVVTEIEEVLENHAMLNTVLFETPVEWLNRNQVPTYPVASYAINSGSLNVGREQIYRVDLWLLDQSGRDGEFETSVISAMHGVAYDVLSILRKGGNSWIISPSVSWIAVSEKFEDYLSGVKITFDLTVVRDYGSCDTPTVS
jgi:hypothetical protein